MDVTQLRELVRLMREEGLVELEVEDGAGRVRLVRSGAGPVAGASASRRVRRNLAREAADRTAEPSGSPAAIPGGFTAILSPMVGTFYRAPAPGAAPFVEVGDSIVSGQVVCIVEAMKMMNEVRAETAGRILRVISEDGAAVEYGSPLYEVGPAE